LSHPNFKINLNLRAKGGEKTGFLEIANFYNAIAHWQTSLLKLGLLICPILLIAEFVTARFSARKLRKRGI
jgi:hypothetical protein